MKTSISNTLMTVTGAALLLGAAVLPARSAESSGSEWYSPMASVMTPGALKPATSADPSAAKAAPGLVGTPKMLLMKGVQLMHAATKAPVGASATPQLQYYGGPLLPNIKVQIVYWNKDVANQDKLPGFFSAITQSPYFDWLKEYNTPNYKIGRGALLGAYTDPSPNPSTALEDADVRTELTGLIGKNAVPQPDANTLYMIYFPPGVNIDLQGSGSCQVFCAYHNTYMNNGQEVNYGIIPDQGGSCAGGCGADPVLFNNETSVSSHEMIETVTDPAVGLVQGNTPQAPLGWYDTTNGEIGDICNAVQGKVGDYTVQRVWSNSRNLCVDSASDAGVPAATGQ
ncbi:MAG TPA: hypothetical protein VH309_12225 [Elusimicrobiota bacterium]|nr:hypothetical protein [Elusimicrobiota bacterium]